MLCGAPLALVCAVGQELAVATDDYSAPFVRYPAGRSARLGGSLAITAALSAVVLASWTLGNAVKTPLQIGIALLVWLLGVVCVSHFWLRSPVGELVWSGKSWSMESPLAIHAVPVLEVHLDLQAFLWLRLERSGLRPQWVWLERRTAPERWLDLRRAVYSRPKPGAPGAPHSAWFSDR